LCPQGWRVPSVDDFEVLIQYLEDHKPADYNSFPEMILSPDPGHWQFPSSMIGTPKNSTGLSLRGGGIRLNFAIDSTAFWQSYQQVCWLSTSSIQGGNNLSYFKYTVGAPNIYPSMAAASATAATHVRCLME
jgi:uncharacterized protein (TIGR02145 family)